MITDLLNLLLPADLVDSIAHVFVALFVLALIASAVVQWLKLQGKISDGEAGKWNARISYALMGLTFIITQVFGLGQSVLDDASKFVDALMGLLTGGFLVTIIGKLIYLVAKFAGIFKSNAELMKPTTLLKTVSPPYKDSTGAAG